MTNIGQLMADITAKIKTVSALNGRVSFVAGGRPGDPTMRKAPIPCAWPVYAGDSSQATKQNLPHTPVQHEVMVKVILAYTNSEADMANIQYPVLQEIIKAVTEGTIDSIKGTCTRWSYSGQSIEEIDDRLVYVQRYSVQGSL